MFRRPRTVSFVNGRVVTAEGMASSIRFDERIVGLDEPPRQDDHVVDLDGAFVLPGLINAHDHLELNHYGQLKRRDRYQNASAWIDDLRPALAEDRHIQGNRAYPLRDRLFIGGLKNVLAGVTTVAHHNPIYRELKRRFPVRVVQKVGWAHSFALEGRPVGANGERGGRIADQCRETPSTSPFIVHAAEGVDAAATDEIARLEALGCLRPGTVLVHGVALTNGWWSRLLAAGVSLVWCPASNMFLLGRTIPARTFLDAGPDAWSHLCLGSDSRVTGARDLLDEIRVALSTDPVTPSEILRMVTAAAARILKLPDAGQLAVGRTADLLVIPAARESAAESLSITWRADVRLVAIGGQPVIGDRGFCALFGARGVEARPIAIDGTEHVAAAALARDIARCPIQEPGVASVA
jgi:cytosine/adenosine deaminase-related metal-dependent hydrolase